jgi:putative membrane-bound dehydrogenase-like protein
MPRRLLAAILFGLWTAPSLAQKSPDETVKSMAVADGLQVELFAAEPMLINPTSIDVDQLGRVWVCEAVNYRRILFKRPMLRPEGDRIVILTDKDGDGKADESTVFYQGKDLIAPIGIAVAPLASGEASAPRGACKVFVCQSPDILLFEDKDGDGKADGPPKKFLSGFRGLDHDHGVHGITIGPDGKLYFTVGDQGVDGLQSADGKGRKWKSNTTDCQAGTVWRCDMDGTNLELIAHNFRNNYEACVNSFGEVWLSDNDDDGNQQTRICFVMPGGNYGYFPRGPGQSHWHEEQPGIVHKALRTGFGSPTGICFYEGTLLPEKYRGQLLHTDAGPRELRCFHIKPKGAGYELTQENLVTSTDSWFRLSDVCVAPDGSLMLADWYDPGVGGHGMGDWTRGRIYRVTPKGHKRYKVPAVQVDTKEGVLEALGSPCLATRAIALGWLASRTEADATKSLTAALRTMDKADDTLVARVMWLLSRRSEGPEGVSTVDQASALKKEFRRLLGDKQDREEFKAEWARVAIDVHSAAYILSSLSGVALDIFAKNASVSELRELLIGMRAISEKDVKEDFPPFREYSLKNAFYTLAKRYDGQDHFYRAALNIACGTDPERRRAILADFDKHFPEWNDRVADLVWELRPASVLPRLGKLLEDPKLTPAQKGRIVDILAVTDDPAAGQTLLALLGREALPEIKSRAIDNLRTFLPTKWKDLQKGDAVRDAIRALLKSNQGKLAGLQLAAAAPDCANATDVEDIAADKALAADVRTAAVGVIGKIHHVKYFHTLEEMISDPVIGPAAVAAIGEFVGGKGVNSGGKESLDLLQKLVTDEKTADALRRAALNALVATRQGTGLLLQIREQNKLPEALVADTGRLLRNSPFQGERNKAMLLFPAPGKLDPKKLPASSVLAQRTGDPKRGEQVFQASLKGEAQCMRCHMVRGVGGNIGPDLSMIGKKASKENLYDSLLLPSKAIADQFLQWKVDTLDGKTVTGLLVAESEAGLTLRDANGKDHTFAAKDLEGPKQKSLVSIMPDNLVAALTEDELTDLVEYMLTLKTASLTPDSWHLLGPFPNDAADSALDKDLGLETAKTIDLTAPFQGPNGPLRWSTVHVNATGYVDLMAHHAGKSAHSASYLSRVIESPADQDGTILVGNDDGAKIWINGEKVSENRDHLAATPARHRVPVKLKKGPNAVLIKIVNGNDPHGLYFALTSEQELKLLK